MKNFIFSNIFTTSVFWVVVILSVLFLWDENRARSESGIPKHPTCLENESISSCYTRFYTALTIKGGTDLAISDIRKRYITDSSVQILCHPLMHIIGHAAAGSAEDISSAFAKGSPFCLSGYYHGVVEIFVERGGEKMLTEGEGINDICSRIKKEKPYSFEHFNCVHGIGHGIMAATYNNLPSSLKTCDLLREKWEQGTCYGGIYMQNMMVDDDEHKTRYLKSDDPFYPCNAVAEKYQEQCWNMQTTHILAINGRDFKKAFSLCDSLNESLAATCYKSLGRDASGEEANNPKQASTLCLLGATTEQRKNCAIGAAINFLQYNHSDVRAKETCNFFSRDISTVCLQAVADYYATF